MSKCIKYAHKYMSKNGRYEEILPLRPSHGLGRPFCEKTRNAPRRMRIGFTATGS